MAAVRAEDRRSGRQGAEHAVVVAGGGPSGLMLAGELALAGIDVVVVERRTSQEVDGSRAGGLHARTIEVLDQRGIADRFLSAGQVMQVAGFAGVPLDISDFPTRHNYGLALWQSQFEPILADWVVDLGVPILRGHEVVGVTQDGSGVDVELTDGARLRGAYLVGCDGGRSVVRKAAGIDFPGLEPSTSWMIAEVEMDSEPELGFRRDSAGQHALGRRQAGEPVRVVLTERTVDHTGEPDLEELRAALMGVYGTDFGLRSASWISRFTDMARQAASYRSGRVLLAGDAAHVHPPQGGQGLNTGVQDAVNLGWKLAQVVRGTTPDSLLDTYHAERHPVGARVLHNTMAQVALASPDDRHQALRDTMSELLDLDEPRRRFAGMISGLDIHYDLGEGHPLLGRRMPDLDLRTAEGPMRVYALLHDARPVLLNLDEPGAVAIAAWADRVRVVDAGYEGRWELPVIGEVAAPPAVLVRPDGHVAWVGAATDPELPRALGSWFGTGVRRRR
jgi:3-(3-hydroxy-phenyl)propionate hydroxylase